jgi:hypothetical protein
MSRVRAANGGAARVRQRKNLLETAWSGGPSCVAGVAGCVRGRRRLVDAADGSRRRFARAVSDILGQGVASRIRDTLGLDCH